MEKIDWQGRMVAGRNLMSAIGTDVLGAGYIAGLAVYVVSAFLRAGCALDTVLTSQGMISKCYLLFGRQYRGEVEGRGVEVYFVPSRALWPTQLDIYVEADIGTRMAMGRRRPWLDCRDCARWAVVEVEPVGFQAYAREGARASRLLSEAAGRETLTRLLDGQEEYGFREVHLQPKRVWLRAHPRRMTEGQFRQWLDDVLILAEMCEETA